MCGIVGLVTSKSNGLTTKEADAFGDMLYVDTLRGWDSTGVFGVSHHANVWMVKDALEGPDFLRTKEYQEFKRQMINTGKFVVGHNRAATRGEVKDVNAHPFIIDDKIVLVQNGSYKGSHKHLKDTEVDTEAVAHTIAENDNVEEALQKINASYALVWYNADTKQMHLIRNNERPLWFAMYEGTGMLFASEPTTILFAAGRNNIKLDAAPEMLEASNHMVLTLDGKGGYTKELNKINNSFVHQRGVYSDLYEMDYGFTPRNNNLPHQPNPLALAYSVNNAQYTPARPHTRHGKQDVKYLFQNEIMMKNQGLLFNSIEEATAAQTVTQESAVEGKLYVETYDYIACNDQPDCEAFHVWGYSLDQHIDPNEPHCLVHWLVFGKTENEIDQMVDSGFWIVKPSTYQIRKIVLNGVEKYLLTVYGTETKAMQSSEIPN